MRPLSREKQGQGLQQQGQRFLLCLSASCRFAVSKHCCFSLKRVPLSHKHREDRSWAGSARGTISLSLSLPQESPSSPSIAEMNGGRAAGFIKYE